MKEITIYWRQLSAKEKKEEYSIYESEMRVLHSTHPRFIEGTRFDFGFMTIASQEGYKIILLPQ